MTAPVTPSPWLTLRQAAAGFPMKRSPRFVAREIKAGRLRGAQIGGRGEYVTRADWVNEYLEELARPVIVQARRRA